MLQNTSPETSEIQYACLPESLQRAISDYFVLSESGGLLKGMIPVVSKRVFSNDSVCDITAYRCNLSNDGWELAFIDKDFFETYLNDLQSQNFVVKKVVDIS